MIERFSILVQYIFTSNIIIINYYFSKYNCNILEYSKGRSLDFLPFEYYSNYQPGLFPSS